jgi:hypothetical protein
MWNKIIHNNGIVEYTFTNNADVQIILNPKTSILKLIINGVTKNKFNYKQEWKGENKINNYLSIIQNLINTKFIGTLI